MIFNFKAARLLVFVFAVVLTLDVTAQPKQNNYYKMKYSSWFEFIPGNSFNQPFYISSKPVTNREYILYMVWITMVYKDHPAVLIEALPGVKSKYWLFDSDVRLIFLDSTYFNEYLDKAEPFVKNYLFNLNYLDYPVIGITWAQANNFTRWFTDRYNEYSVVKTKHLQFEENQLNFDHFSTEAFIFRQYTGKVDKVLNYIEYDSDKIHYYLDYNMRPAFHVVTKSEINSAEGVQKLFSEFKNYYEEKSDFLKPFWDFYFELDKDVLRILPKFKSYEWRTPIKLYRNHKLNFNYPFKANEWLLDSYLDTMKIGLIDILSHYGYKRVNYQEIVKRNYLSVRKDLLGNLPYLIVGEIDSVDILERDSPMYWKDVSKENALVYDNSTKSVVRMGGDIFTTFRVAVNAVKKNKKK